MQAPPPSPPPARIAFQHGRAVWTMDANGDDRRRALPRASGAVWSPDGTRLAVVRGRRILTVTPDGADPVTVARVSHGGIGAPAWSRDGTRIAFATLRFTDRRLLSSLEVVGSDGTGRRAVLRRADGRTFSGFGAPAWQPDGTGLLYTLQPYAAAADVRAVALDGTGDHRLIARAEAASFSPDGTRIVFATVAGTKGETCGSDECYPDADVATAAPDGSDRRVLLRTSTDEPDPRWSADGSRVLFSSGRNVARTQYPPTEVYSVAADGSCLTWLTNGNVDSGSPDAGPGTAAPASCSTDRPVRIERPRGPARSGPLWLGLRFGTALLEARQRPGFLSYDDCSAFAPRDCPPPFLLNESTSCRDDVPLRYDLRNLHAVRRVGDVVVARVRRDVGTYVLAGRTLTYIQANGRTSDALTRQVARGLRRVGGGAPGGPHLPRRLLGRLPARARGWVRPC